MDIHESIYQPHREEPTLRYAIAYLIATEAQPAHTDRKLGLEEQRHQIGQKAIELQAVVVAEFIETGTDGHVVLRPGFQDAIWYAKRFHPSMFIHPGEDQLNLRPGDSVYFRFAITHAGMRIIPASL